MLSGGQRGRRGRESARSKKIRERITAARGSIGELGICLHELALGRDTPEAKAAAVMLGEAIHVFLAVHTKKKR